MSISATPGAFCAGLGFTKSAIIGSVLAPIEVAFGIVLNPTELSPMWAKLDKKGVAKARAFILSMIRTAKPNKS